MLVKEWKTIIKAYTCYQVVKMSSFPYLIAFCFSN